MDYDANELAAAQAFQAIRLALALDPSRVELPECYGDAEVLEDAITDLMIDLLHLTRRADLDVDLMLERVLGNFAEEDGGFEEDYDETFGCDEDYEEDEEDE